MWLLKGGDVMYTTKIFIAIGGTGSRVILKDSFKEERLRLQIVLLEESINVLEQKCFDVMKHEFYKRLYCQFLYKNLCYAPEKINCESNEHVFNNESHVVIYFGFLCSVVYYINTIFAIVLNFIHRHAVY